MSNVTGHFNFIDTDCYYYLRLLASFLQNFPRPLLFDPLADWPSGAQVDWPEGFLLLVGIPLKIFGVDSYQGLEWGVAIVMSVLGLAACLLLFSVSSRLIKEFSLRMLVLFLASCNFLLIRFSCLGQVDHHIMEAFFPPALFGLLYLTFQDRKVWASVALGLMLSFSLTISSSSFFTILGFYVTYALCFSKPENRGLYLRICLIFLLTLMLNVIWSVSRRGNPYAVNYPSYFHLSVVGFLSIATYFFCLAGRYRWWIFLGCVGVFALSIGTNWPQVFAGPINMAFNYVFEKRGVLQNVSEAFPLFSTYGGFAPSFMHINFGFLIYLLPLAWVGLIFWKVWSVEERGLLVLLSVMSIPSLAQKRFCHLMVGLYLVFLVWLLTLAIQKLRVWNFKAWPLLIPAFVLAMILPLFDSNFAPSGSPRDAVDLGSSHEFLKNFRSTEAEAWRRLGGQGRVDEGIWTNPNVGHMMLYYTGLGAVVNSFYHDSSFALDFKLRLTESTEDFVALLKENKIRYFFVQDDWQFFELQHTIQDLPYGKYKTVRRVRGQDAVVYNMPELLKLAWVRFLNDAAQGPHVKNLFTLKFNEPHFYTYVRGYEVLGGFEETKGLPH